MNKNNQSSISCKVPEIKVHTTIFEFLTQKMDNSIYHSCIIRQIRMNIIKTEEHCI